jgi:hypothetical protein
MFQFSIRSLLLLTTACAVLVWVLFAPPQLAGALVMLALCLLLPPVVVAGILYQRSYWRAFFIGAAPWTAGMFFWLSYLILESLDDGDWLELFVMSSADAVEMKLYAGPPLGIILCSGLTAMAIRWWAARQGPAKEESPRS